MKTIGFANLATCRRPNPEKRLNAAAVPVPGLPARPLGMCPLSLALPCAQSPRRETAVTDCARVGDVYL